MSQENQVIGSMPVENLPVKRKRGRPRKDDSLLRHVRRSAVETPRSDPVTRSTCRDKIPVSNGDGTLLGQVVSGVLEETFDAGYLIKVKVGESDTFLRGVVFDPRFVLPISAANDVASNVKMVKRNETSIATPIQLQGSARRVKQRNELPPPPPLNTVPSQTQSSTPVASKGVQFDINQIPQVSPLRQAETRTMSSAFSPSEKQGNDASQAIQVLPSQSTYRNSFGTLRLQNAGILSLREAPHCDGNGIETQHKPGPVTETPQVNETNSKFTEAPQQVVLLLSEPNQTINSASKVQVVDLNDTPADGAADFLASEAIGDPTMNHKAFGGSYVSVPPGMQPLTPKLVPEPSKTAETNHTQPTCGISIKKETPFF